MRGAFVYLVKLSICPHIENGEARLCLIQRLWFCVGDSMFWIIGLNDMNPSASAKLVHRFSEEQLSRIIEMAWEDRTPFEAIESNFGLNESAVIHLMRRQIKPKSFRLWRKRVSGRKTKHQSLRSPDVSRGYCPTQYKR